MLDGSIGDFPWEQSDACSNRKVRHARRAVCARRRVRPGGLGGGRAVPGAARRRRRAPAGVHQARRHRGAGRPPRRGGDRGPDPPLPSACRGGEDRHGAAARAGARGGLGGRVFQGRVPRRGPGVSVQQRVRRPPSQHKLVGDVPRHQHARDVFARRAKPAAVLHAVGPPPARRRALRRVHRREAPLRARGGGQAGRHAVHVRDPGRHLPAVLERRGLGLRVLRQRQRGVLQLARRPLPRRRGSRPASRRSGATTSTTSV